MTQCIIDNYTHRVMRCQVENLTILRLIFHENHGKIKGRIDPSSGG